MGVGSSYWVYRRLNEYWRELPHGNAGCARQLGMATGLGTAFNLKNRKRRGDCAPTTGHLPSRMLKLRLVFFGPSGASPCPLLFISAAAAEPTTVQHPRPCCPSQPMTICSSTPSYGCSCSRKLAFREYRKDETVELQPGVLCRPVVTCNLTDTAR